MISVQLGTGSVAGFLAGLALVWWLEPVTRNGAIAVVICCMLAGVLLARLVRLVMRRRMR